MGARAVFAAERLSPLGKVVEMDCGDITSSQEELLARAPFLGGGGEEEEPEVFSTPPLTHGHHQGQGDEGGDDKEGDVITMCSLPFTQTQTQPSPSPSPPDEVVRPRKPRVCIRKVRGARIRTPTPSPDGRRAGGCRPALQGRAHDPHASCSPHRSRGHPHACPPARHLLIS
ncbi:hypothetical protein BS78_K249700 [Paspalum vaginatum]|uniref:Uncharacterized protein n=1 Tax=Paspalum vaginatum TaxID=158149 RepID=A0A9W7X6P1_9POAL|nr:hypothetical protein BS78_K249700 [Paspalum vaginatum]